MKISQKFFNFFILGEYFIEYDIRAAKMKEYDSYGNKYPRKIRDAFKHGPSSVDAVLYKKSENLIYLFKDSFVSLKKYFNKKLNSFFL